MQAVNTSFAKPPTPVLPAYPAWVAAYWQSWRGDQPQSAAADALVQVRTLQARGLDDEAFAAACAFMDRAAADRPPDAGCAQNTASQWPALATLLVETLIGLTWAGNSVHWEMRLDPPVGLHGLALDGNVVSLTAEADTGAGVLVVVDAAAPFDLTIRTEFTTFHEQAPAGQTRYLLTYLDRTDILTAGT